MKKSNQNKIKIFFVNKFSCLSSSPMTTVSILSTYGLANIGLNTILITTGKVNINIDRFIKQRFGLKPLKNYHIKILKRRKLLGLIKTSISFYLNACKFIMKNKAKYVNIIITRNSNFLPYLFIMKKIFRFKVFFESHGYHGDASIKGIPKRKKRNFFQKYNSYRIYEGLFLNHIDGLICITKPQKALYRKDFVYNNILHLPLGSYFQKEKKESYSVLPEYTKRTLVFIGRLTDHIDVNVIFNALENCKTQNIYLIWIGLKPKDIKYLKELTRRYNITDLVKLFEWKPHKKMVQLMRAKASVGLAAYKNTFRISSVASPTKIFDYLSIGLPIITGNIDTMNEFIQDGYNGCLYKPGDYKSLLFAIKRIFSNENNYKIMQRNALKTAKYYSWNNRAKRVTKFFSDVCNFLPKK